MLAHKGLPHWGQLIDRTVPGHGSFYSRFQEWRNIYARFSNNFATRSFENNLSARWQLTAPDPITMPVEVPALVGHTLTDAKRIVAAAPGGLKLTPIVVGPSGTVLLQRPLAGCRVPPGWTVNVSVG